VLTGGAGLRSMQRAAKELWGPKSLEALSDIPMAGRTDAWIVRQVAESVGLELTSAELERFRRTYLEHLPGELERPGPRKGVMPGIRDLLDTLVVREGVHLTLLTGNFREGARAKLEYFDLWRYFVGGGFGDAATDRNHLVNVALDAVVAAGGPKVPPTRAVVIGDTPLDVGCAAACGASCIAVATGGFGPAALHAAGADTVFEDLSETAAVLREIDRLVGGPERAD
jgi:phosphoglycolate phosphatase